MSSPLHFPDANTLKECLCNHPILKQSEYQKKGYTNSVVQLALEKLADKDMGEEEADIKIFHIFLSLQRGTDIKGNRLPNYGNWIPNNQCPRVASDIEKAILDCAKKV